MKYKSNLLLTVVLLAIFLGCTSLKDRRESKNQETNKNVLFIVVDDLNTTLGCYGHPVVKTPNIDKLAESGVKFNHAYCNYAVCGPSRGSFLTGLRPESINILDNRTPLRGVLGDRITLPHLFRMNGFYTMSLGKVFHGSKEQNDINAWDEIYDFGATELGKTGVRRNLTNGDLKWCEWMAANGDDEDQSDGQIASKAVELGFINLTTRFLHQKSISICTHWKIVIHQFYRKDGTHHTNILYPEKQKCSINSQIRISANFFVRIMPAQVFWMLR